MGAKGAKVQAVTQEYNVQIKFPDREPRHDEVKMRTEGMHN